MYPLALLHCLVVNNYYSNNILPLIENWKLSLSEYKKTLYTNRNELYWNIYNDSYWEDYGFRGIQY